jgi:hypothetical protein
MCRTTDRLLFMILLGAAACSSGSGSPAPGDAGSTCPNAPTSCSKPIPSYSAVIEPILQQNCIPCHGPMGSAGYSEATYELVDKQVEPILSFVSGCMMPPSSYPPLTAEQRDALLDWLVCGAPNN